MEERKDWRVELIDADQAVVERFTVYNKTEAEASVEADLGMRYVETAVDAVITPKEEPKEDS